MEKLVWVITFSDGCTYTIDTPYCFEFTSKDDFIYYILELIEKAKISGENQINPFKSLGNILDDGLLDIEDCEDVDRCVFTLDEWFNNHKHIIK
jgi:hypothetical protein